MLSPDQRNYTLLEKELPVIVKSLKDFEFMLGGANITLYTNHKNLSYDDFKT